MSLFSMRPDDQGVICDMEKDEKDWAMGVCKDAVYRGEDQTEISKTIKTKFEKKYGPTWHCIVGSEFRAFTSFESKTYMYIPIGVVGKQAVLLYKCDSSS